MPRYAAIDIGSNSVRMEAAEMEPSGPVRILASDREVTRLGEGVYRAGRITSQAMELTCAVLARMAAAYKSLDVAGVRAVATSAVRDARNQAEFVERASEAAGTPVEVIAGREEARLIQLGVQARWPQPGRRVLMIDLGGGSAEIIAAESGRMLDAVSKPLGAVRLREIFLADDPPAEKQLRQMQQYIQEKLSSLPRRFGAAHWSRAIATSATAAAAACVIGGVPRAKRDRADRIRVSASQVRRLFDKLSRLDLAGRRAVSGIGPRRAEIIVPGVAVLLNVLSTFELGHLYYSAAGVRDGIIADLAARGVGKERAQLSLEQRKEVERLSLRYGVALKHARKVAALSRTLFSCLQPLHELPLEYGKLLEAAAFLHDVGHYVSDASHHKHSYYLVANSDMPGFTNRERECIANLCRYHRKSLPAAGHPGYRCMRDGDGRALLKLVPLLRIADSLDRGHAQRIRSLACDIRPEEVVIRLDSPVAVDLELWAAERVGEVFHKVYGLPVQLSRRSR
jgi:exopolyphosphatase/guanosine-5'-triphosphate,3'-diphosphate pyrophosphatase